MPAPDIIRQLVERFEYNKEAYQSSHYNEAQLREEFLNPFFKALGWDIYNEKNYALQYREVIHEDSIHIKGSPNAKAPDYAFRLGGKRIFFVEAKKPAEDIQNTKEYAYQLKIYAWNSGLPLSILTDFEEFAVYDCRSKPNLSDRPATGRVMYIKKDQYLDRWDEIAGIFSPEAIRKGAFDKYAEDNTAKKGTIKVDDAFLAEIESWRTLLARNIALRNQQVINERQLNFAVQMTIDRIIFLRICEDRGIEPENQLFTLSNQKDIYQRLVALFERADLKYNSGLFHFKAEAGNQNNVDSFTPSLAIDDKILKEIIKSLYYPCPYVFKEIPVEILGQVYEQFLGKVIRLTPGHRAKIEEKPEVRKAGGVYYTPKYIVDYIVENTVGKLLEDKTPDEAAKLKILDPACGSGSFLLGAFQYLMDWHEEWYLAHDPEKWTRGRDPALVQTAEGDWRLTTDEKKRILVNNIHGVDIDQQAVEVTKLSLLLKVLEEETGQLTLGFERALPDLNENIKCGNSLIGWDYFEGQLVQDAEEVARVNPFDWKKNFQEIFANGGFDAVIGNPPYIRIQTMKEWATGEVDYFGNKYISASNGNYDIYVVFIEKGINLINVRGQLGFILPSKFFVTDYGKNIRNLISEGDALSKIIDFGSYQIFDQATTYTCLLFLSGRHNEKFLYTKVADPDKLDESEFIDVEQFEENKTWAVFDNLKKNLILKINLNSKALGKLPTRIGRGSSSGNDKIFILSKKGDKLLSKNGEIVEIEPEILRVPIHATDFSRYQFNPKGDKFIIFPYLIDDDGYELIDEIELKNKFPKAFDYLLRNKKTLEKRKQYKVWYSFSAPRNLDVHENAQLLVPLLSNKGSFCKINANDNKYCLMASGGFSITVSNDCPLDINYVLGLLNSKLLFWNLQLISNVFRGGWITCTKQYVKTLPIYKIDFNNQREVTIHNDLVSLVCHLNGLNKRRPKTPYEKEELQREIDATDAQIDRLVYELYGLTEEEIKIVEGDR